MKSILLYVVLVGIPLLGIVGLLQVGQSLSAPVSLAGKWDAQLFPAQPQDSAPQMLLRAGPTIVSITQSGPNLRLSFDDPPSTILEGSIRDLTVSASVLNRRAAAATNPSNFTPIAFRARVERQTPADRLVGVLIVDEGSVRTELPLTAIRQAEAGKATGGQ